MATQSTSSTTGATVKNPLTALMKTSKEKTKTTGAADSADQFLTLLMTQMKNQDPLKPMDNAEVTSQLAQINTVKGIGQLNASMEKLLGAYGDSLSMQSSSMIGKRVLSAGDDLALGASGATGGVELKEKADMVTVIIKDGSGKEVARESLGSQAAGVVAFNWDGVSDNDQRLANGNYTFSVEAKRGSGKVEATALQSGTVTALVKSSSGFQLEVGDAGLVKFESVKQIF